jgi:hypothetical protein
MTQRVSDEHKAIYAKRRTALGRYGDPEEVAHITLGSGLIDHIQKMTVAAIQMPDMKVWAHRSYRVWMRRQS